MKKSLLAISHIDESGIKARHELLYLGKIEVTHRVGSVARLLLK